MKNTVRTVDFCGVEISYTLEYKSVKNINLRVKPDGVFVSAPPQTPAREIDAFVCSKGSFIVAARNRVAARAADLPMPRRFEDGEIFLHLGRALRLAVIASDDERVQFDDAFIYLYVSDTADFAKKQRLYHAWISRRCEKVFAGFVKDVYEKMKGSGVPYPTMRIKDMRSRWGSCIPQKGVITLNMQLIKAPPACIEYVVVHEIAHFLHPDHSEKFHTFVASILPDWKDRKHALDQVRIVPGQI
ncbi:MAG: M48 family metallopeptidase [Clostridia bacterium]|nr:M48 family metallopeptidase [Clostridia bacterium]